MESITLKVLNDIVKDVKIKDDKGNVIGVKPKVVKRNIISRIELKKATLVIAEYVTERGTISKSRCFVRDQQSNINYLVKGNYDKLRDVIFNEDYNQVVVKGFRK